MQFNSNKKSGFTLVEVLVVVFIISILSLMIFPRIQLDSPDRRLKTDVRRFTGLVRYLRGVSATENRLHKLYIDLDEGKYWVMYPDDRGEEIKLRDSIIRDGELDEGVSFKEVQTEGKLTATEGQTSILFYSSGEIEASEILFRNKKNTVLHLRIHPLTGRCRIWQEQQES